MPTQEITQLKDKLKFVSSVSSDEQEVRFIRSLLIELETVSAKETEVYRELHDARREISDLSETLEWKYEESAIYRTTLLDIANVVFQQGNCEGDHFDDLTVDSQRMLSDMSATEEEGCTP
jgi:hypothetical protein